MHCDKKRDIHHAICITLLLHRLFEFQNQVQTCVVNFYRLDIPFFKPHGKNQIKVFLFRFLFLFIFLFFIEMYFPSRFTCPIFFSLSPHLFTLCGIKIREMKASQNSSNKGLLRFTHGRHTERSRFTR